MLDCLDKLERLEEERLEEERLDEDLLNEYCLCLFAIYIPQQNPSSLNELHRSNESAR